MAEDVREVAAVFRLKVDKSGFDQAEASLEKIKNKLGASGVGKSAGDSLNSSLDYLEKKFSSSGGKADDGYGKAFDRLKKRYAGLSEIGKDLAKSNKKPDDSILDSIIPGLNAKKTGDAGAALLKLHGQGAGLGKELGELFHESSKKCGELGEGVSGLVEKFGAGGLGGALGAIGAGATVVAGITAGLFELVKASAEVGHMAEIAAIRSGVTTQEFQRLAFAGRFAGVGAEELKNGLQRVAIAYEEAKKGTGQHAEAFKALGLNWRDLKGQSPAQMLETISDRMMKLPPTERIAVSKKIGKTWADMLPLLTAGSHGLKEAGDEAEKFNLVMSEEQIKNSVEFVENWKRAGGILEGFRNALAKDLLPIMTHVVESFVDWYKANKDIIDQRVETTVRGIAAAFKLWGESLEPLIASLDLLVAKPFTSLVDVADDISNWINGDGESLIGDAFTMFGEKMKEWAYDVEQYMLGIIPVDKWLDKIDDFIDRALELLGPLAGPLGMTMVRNGVSGTRAAAGGVFGGSQGLLDAAGTLTGGAWTWPGALEGISSLGAPEGVPIASGPNGEPIYASAAGPSIPSPSIPGGPVSSSSGDVTNSQSNNITINGATDADKVASMIEDRLAEQWREVEEASY